MRKTKEQKQNTNKGITLIALIITIIVMLILVAVTITVAVNGGLFEHAGQAVGDTQNAIDEEKELANLEVNMTVDELIDKYTGGSDETGVKIGDYVSNYPVEYTNVATAYDLNTGEEKGYYPRDEFTGWRVLSKETDDSGNTYVKLISAGVPLSYYQPFESGASATSVTNLTTGFLTTEINSSTMENYKFYKCGFNVGDSTNLNNIFANLFTDKVEALTKEDIDFVTKTTTHELTLLNDAKYSDLLVVPCKGTESNKYCRTWLATPRDSDTVLYCTFETGELYSVYVGGYTHGAIGIRPVVTLKSSVKFTPASQKINNTTTWQLSF